MYLYLAVPQFDNQDGDGINKASGKNRMNMAQESYLRLGATGTTVNLRIIQV